MKRDELKQEIDNLMQQYSDEKIDGATYFQKMMKLTTSKNSEKKDED